MMAQPNAVEIPAPGIPKEGMNKNAVPIVVQQPAADKAGMNFCRLPKEIPLPKDV